MPYRYAITRRLEPVRPSGHLERALRAEIADPVWFLTRQWQLGEHQGEDAGSPVNVNLSASSIPIDPLAGDPGMDPLVVPPEVIIESEPADWWTPGRRLRVGAAAAPFVLAANRADPELQVSGLPVPYDRFDGQALDGLALHRRRVELALPDGLFEGVPVDPVDLWDPAELVHTAAFTAGSITLTVPRHDGGDVDWYSVDASGPPTVPAVLPAGVDVVPGRLAFPGAPHPRWWQIEDARVDLGGLAPDRGHLASSLLLDLITSHTDDWFTFPVQAGTGTIITLHRVTVRDGFGVETDLGTPATWGMFHVRGLDPTSLVLWPTVALPLTGVVEDEVLLGVDEDANLLWAVERRVGGRELAPPLAEPPTDVPAGSVQGDAPARYIYRPSTTLPPFWHPYPIAAVDVNGRRRFVQGRLADLSTRPPVPMPAPVSPLLYDPHAAADGPVHQIEPATIPANGIRLERRWVLGRRTDGLPALWRQRRRTPLLGPPVSGLRFDVADEVATPSAGG
jgi:hypothetical protein